MDNEMTTRKSFECNANKITKLLEGLETKLRGYSTFVGPWNEIYKKPNTTATTVVRIINTKGGEQF
jgi:hypothetical protein